MNGGCFGAELHRKTTWMNSGGGSHRRDSQVISKVIPQCAVHRNSKKFGKVKDEMKTAGMTFRVLTFYCYSSWRTMYTDSQASPVRASLLPLLDFRSAITFSRRSFSRSSEAVRVGDRDWKRILRSVSAQTIMCCTVHRMVREREDRTLLPRTLYEALPTSWVLFARLGVFSGLVLLACGGFLLSSSAEESAVLRRLSTGEDTEDVLRLLLPAGAYLCIERCLFLSLCLSGPGLALVVVWAGLGARSLLRLRRRSSRCLRALR